MKLNKKFEIKKFISCDEEIFENLIDELTDGLVEVSYDFNLVFFDATKKADETNTYFNGDIKDILASYFDVDEIKGIKRVSEVNTSYLLIRI